MARASVSALLELVWPFVGHKDWLYVAGVSAMWRGSYTRYLRRLSDMGVAFRTRTHCGAAFHSLSRWQWAAEGLRVVQDAHAKIALHADVRCAMHHLASVRHAGGVIRAALEGGRAGFAEQLLEAVLARYQDDLLVYNHLHRADDSEGVADFFCGLAGRRHGFSLPAHLRRYWFAECYRARHGAEDCAHMCFAKGWYQYLVHLASLGYEAPEHMIMGALRNGCADLYLAAAHRPEALRRQATVAALSGPRAETMYFLWWHELSAWTPGAVGRMFAAGKSEGLSLTEWAARAGVALDEGEGAELRHRLQGAEPFM